MSNDSNNSGNDLDLSALNFGPSWARDETKDKKDYSKYEGKSDHGDRKNRRHSPRDGGRDQPRRNDRAPRRDGGGNKSGGKRFDKQRRDGGNAPYRQEVPIPEGFTAEVMPIEDGLDRLAKQIKDTARTYSVFDLARLVLQSRERFNVGFIAPKGQKLFRNIISTATFLTKEEAISDFWKSEVKEQIYREVKKETEAPSGNFPSVAKCTKSGVYLGPPNHHEYQSKLRELYQERFGHLSFERFQRQIVIEQGVDAVNAWKESVKFQTYYVPISAIPAEKTLATEEKTPPSEQSPEMAEDASGDKPIEGEVATLETEIEKDQSEESDTTEAASHHAEEKSEQKESNGLSVDDLDESLLIKTRAELQRHFLANHFCHYYKEVSKSWVSGAVAGRLISPGLLTLLKEAVSQERRYPGKLSSMMCRQLSGRHVAVFKMKKKLKAGPSRPHSIPDPSTLSERLALLLKWAMKNDGQGIDQLWSEVLSEDTPEELKREWYHDLHWLLNQGFIILMEDGTIYISKKEEQAPVQKKEKPVKSKKTAPAPVESKKADDSDSDATSQAEVADGKENAEVSDKPVEDDAAQTSATE